MPRERARPRARRSPHAGYTPAGDDGIGRLELARKLAANVRAASSATKHLTLRSYDVPLERFLKSYVRAQRACWNDRETQANLARYRAGRWAK